MPDDAKPVMDQRSLGQRYISWENIERASHLALQQRQAAGEVMTYVRDGWMVREYPDQRIERLAPVGEFRSGDFPLEP